MKHKVKVTILDKKLYPELQQQYCADPKSGACPCYHVGDEYIFERTEENDSFWRMGLDTLVTSHGDRDTTAGGPRIPPLLRSLGCHLPIHLHWPPRRLHHERMDEERKHDDHLL